MSNNFEQKNILISSKKMFTILLCTIFLLPSNIFAKGIFGSLGRSIRQVGRDIKGTVEQTGQDIKGDVQDETGIPINQIEMRNRIGKIKKKISTIHKAVQNPDVADGAIVFFYNSYSRTDSEDYETLRKIDEYTVGTITDVRKEGISVKKLGRLVGKLQRLLMTLYDKSADLPEDFDFTTAFALTPKDPDDDTGNDDSSEEGYDDEIDSGEGTNDGDGTVNEENPVLLKYRQLQTKHEGNLEGSGYLKIAVGKEGGDAVFALLHPENDALLTDNAAVNRNHKIQAGIYHLVVDVADVRLYKMNIVILPGSLMKFEYLTFGQIEIDQNVAGTVMIIEKESNKVACDGISAGQRITLPTGDYIVIDSDSGTEVPVIIRTKKRRKVSF